MYIQHANSGKFFIIICSSLSILRIFNEGCEDMVETTKWAQEIAQKKFVSGETYCKWDSG
jgi:hypothetical protein